MPTLHRFIPAVCFSFLVMAAYPVCAADDQLTVSVPAAVKTTVTKEIRGGSILSFERVEEDSVYFRVTAKIDGKEYIVTVDANGRLDRIELRNNEEQQEPTLDKFPGPVKAALTKLSEGATVERVEMEKRETNYSVIVPQAGTKYKITVDEAGKLLRKERIDD